MDLSNLSIYKPKMEYRRFGKTNKKISAITCGGMRIKGVWQDPKHIIPKETLESTIDVITKSFELGINLFETAQGYRRSEHAFGKAFNEELNIARDKYFLMTKGDAETAADVRKMVDKQLEALQTDYLDFYAWHGLNTGDILKNITQTGGAIEELHKLRNEGLIKHIGFSTHGPLDVILSAINTDMFEFINLHYYYFFQRNKPAIDLAASKDMGVFIISPNDKGGQLFNPPQKLSDITAPLTPIQWNAKFCLSNPNIHTLTFGFPKTSPFEQVDGIFPISTPLSEPEAAIKEKLDSQLEKVAYSDFDGYNMVNDPSGINIAEVLRFRNMLLGYDMKAFGKYRYNMFGTHWFSGNYPTEENIAKIDMSKCPEGIPLKEMLRETHKALFVEKKK